MRLVKREGGTVTPAISRRMNRGYKSCVDMNMMLSDYAALGKPVVVVENGVRVTKCPPAYARGVWPDKNVGSTGRS